jgi:hypothetical protein
LAPCCCSNWVYRTLVELRTVKLPQYLLDTPPPPRLPVNRTYFRFGRYKNPRRLHPPPRASRVSRHPPLVSGLTLARPHPPPSARPIDSPDAGPFWAPGQRGQNGLPRRCRFPGCTAREGKSALNVTLNWALPPLSLIFSFTNLSRRLLLTTVVRFPISFFFFESYASFSPFTPPVVPVVLSLLSLLSLYLLFMG